MRYINKGKRLFRRREITTRKNKEQITEKQRVQSEKPRTDHKKNLENTMRTTKERLQTNKQSTTRKNKEEIKIN